MSSFSLGGSWSLVTGWLGSSWRWSFPLLLPGRLHEYPLASQFDAQGGSSSELDVLCAGGVVVLLARVGTGSWSLVGVPVPRRLSLVDDCLLGRRSGGVFPWMILKILASSLSSFSFLSSSDVVVERVEERKPWKASSSACLSESSEVLSRSGGRLVFVLRMSLSALWMPLCGWFSRPLT